MRNENSMYDLILSFAKKDERIRLVGMEGSRTNKNVPVDDYQDYDISFIVTDSQPFIEDEGWLDVFGERIITQKPEAMSLFPAELEWFSYLMIFKDGIKIDLSIIQLELLQKYLDSDKLLKILLDKDGLVQNLPEPTDRDYWIQKPSAAFIDDSCNEFWFVSTYIAKGLARDEILFASYHLDSILRPQLFNMLEWKIGVEYGYGFSVGKHQKYIKKYLSDYDWRLLMETYCLDSIDNCWKALDSAHRLFRKASLFMCDNMNLSYPDYDRNVTKYINDFYK